MLQIGAVQIFHDPLVAGTSDIQELSKTCEMVARAKTELWHRILTHYLPLYFPEADRFHRSSRGGWFLAFLEAFPSPHIVTAMDKEAFIAAAWPVIGRRVSKSALLADIYETSKTSVGLPVAPDSDAIRMFRLVLAQGRSLIQQRNAIEARAADLLGDHQDYQLLRSIPGIGPAGALAVLAEREPFCAIGSSTMANDLRRFRHHHQFLKLGRHGSGDHAVRSVPRQEQDTHPRCMNCHPVDDRPRQGDDMRPHMPPVVRWDEAGFGPPGLHCTACHGAGNVEFVGGDGSIPGHQPWHLPPVSMGWIGLSVPEICAQLKDPARNGDRTLAELAEHNATDGLVGWGWHPGKGRTPAPGSQELFGALTEAWIETGAVCPE